MREAQLKLNSPNSPVSGKGLIHQLLAAGNCLAYNSPADSPRGLVCENLAIWEGRRHLRKAGVLPILVGARWGRLTTTINALPVSPVRRCSSAWRADFGTAVGERGMMPPSPGASIDPIEQSVMWDGYSLAFMRLWARRGSAAGP